MEQRPRVVRVFTFFALLGAALIFAGLVLSVPHPAVLRQPTPDRVRAHSVLKRAGRYFVIVGGLSAILGVFGLVLQRVI